MLNYIIIMTNNNELDKELLKQTTEQLDSGNYASERVRDDLLAQQEYLTRKVKDRNKDIEIDDKINYITPED